MQNYAFNLPLIILRANFLWIIITFQKHLYISKNKQKYLCVGGGGGAGWHLDNSAEKIFTASIPEKLEDSKCLTFVDINLIAYGCVWCHPHLYSIKNIKYLDFSDVCLYEKKHNCHATGYFLSFFFETSFDMLLQEQFLLILVSGGGQCRILAYLHSLGH